MARPPDYDPPPGWYENSYDDSQWKAPTSQTHGHWSAHFGLSPGVWHDKHKFTFYRIRPAAAPEWEPPKAGDLMQTTDTHGCWIASILPIPLIWAIYHNTS